MHKNLGNLALSCIMDNIYVKTELAGNIKPDREKSTDCIDVAVVFVVALDRGILNGGIL